MRLHDGRVCLSASDLANHLGCRHLTQLDLRVSTGEVTPPTYVDPTLEALKRRGEEHERAYVEHLRSQGLSISEVHSEADVGRRFETTQQAMRQGVDAIIQATLLSDGWEGRADVLQRVEIPSVLGDYSYEVVDMKLARETRGRTILQLCLYSDILAHIRERGQVLQCNIQHARLLA